MAEHPPAQPAFVLRGHSAQIHAIHFLDDNSCLLTGDGDGASPVMYRVEEEPPPAEEISDIGRERMEAGVDDAGSARVRSSTLQIALTQRTTKSQRRPE